MSAISLSHHSTVSYIADRVPLTRVGTYALMPQQFNCCLTLLICLRNNSVGSSPSHDAVMHQWRLAHQRENLTNENREYIVCRTINGLDWAGVHVEYIGTLWVGWEGYAVASLVPAGPFQWINN